MKNERLFCLAIALGLISSLAHADKADREKPIQITANTGSMDQLRGITVWEGDVVVVQGTLIVHADKVTVTKDAQGNQTLISTGRVVTFRQRADGKSSDGKEQWIDGQANRVDYTSINHTAILTGNARVKKGEDLVIGDVIIYNTETQIYQSRGGAPNTANKGRVTAILQPQKSASDSSGTKP
ncbi:lipopolysaccharide transport periplasmic protein LptA [Paludibacterium yongneupense]|uniref:lipopolysaccharide transport periplasmic protein LptA n=1 Tax=Paludibacterium yongneupense TaxID=400061 RepID=UPI0004266CCA|nr:lipopolysaccharide transport periplasmic protein LptA [Paludibacterium yongneupense]